MSVHDYPSRILGAYALRGRPSPAHRILCEVAAKHGVTVADLKGKSRARRYSWPRQEAMLRLRDETRKSYPEIARLLCRDDHTTILHGERAASARIREGITTG